MDGAPASAPTEGAGGDKGGGGAAQALIELDKMLFQVVSAIQKGQVPDGVKAKFTAALESYRAGLDELMSDEGGAPAEAAPAQKPQGQPMPSAATPEQGANPNAKPMSHGGY